MSSSSHLRLVRIAAIGALVAAFSLAGCGRKGGLDPPPGAAVTDQGGVPPAAGGPQIGPDGKPVAPKGSQQRTPLDWLLN